MAGRPAAFFDFDKTLLDRESSKLLIQYMKERRQIFFNQQRVPLLYLLKLLVANEFYKRHRYSDEKMAILLLHFFKGRRLDIFEALGPDLYRNYLKPHLAPNILVRLEDHRCRGNILVLISAGLRYSLIPVIGDLGFDHLLCTELEIGPDGLLTGRPKGPVCIDVHKRDMAQEFAEEHRIDLQSSAAYGNHHSDIPLLELVGYPVVVEPTEPLMRMAVQRQWPVLSYR